MEGRGSSGEREGVDMSQERRKQIDRDRYYIRLAEAVREGANCMTRSVGAVLVLGDRVLGTGYNGTPSGFPNCSDQGCLRCYDSWLVKQGREAEVSDPAHRSGQALDRCLCVHAEQNALLTAARYGVRVQGATLYTTLSPCLGCLKEALQAGVARLVYESWYPAHYSDDLQRQYWGLADHLSGGEPKNFEALGGGRAPEEEEGQPDPYAEETEGTLQPPYGQAREPDDGEGGGRASGRAR